jgi:hypothetical protein
MGSSPSYVWKLNGSAISGATNATYTSTDLVNNDQITLEMTSSLNGLCVTQPSATSSAITTTVNTATSITAQPSATSACASGTANFTVTGAGQGVLTYQWKKNAVDITGNGTATSSSLTLSGVGVGDVADYTVVVTGTCGAVTSTAAALTINTATAISAQPAAVIQCPGTTALFTVTASGQGTLTYQWRKDGSALAGETNDTLTIANIATVNAGQYSVIVTGGCGNVTSSNALLTVNIATAISLNPDPVTLCAGTTANFSVTASGTGSLSYQWKKDGSNVGTNSSTLSVANAQAANAGTYTVVVSGTCGTVTSSGALLTVNPVTAITTTPSALTLCNGADAVFNVVAAGTGTINYQWKYLTEDIAGATSSTLTLNNITHALNDGTYYVVVSGGTCNSGSINSTPVALTIQAPSNAVSGSQSATCAVKGADWIHFYTSDGKLLVSIKGTTSSADFGSVTATSYVLADAQITTSCADPGNDYYKTAVLGRSWYINPDNNLPATVRLPITNAELAALVTKSAATSTNVNDDVFALADINLSKYNGTNENGSWQDNCNSADSTSYATSNLYILQAASGALSETNGFITTIAGASYVEFSVPGFSEFWLMNSEFATPLPVMLTSLAASCDEKEVSVKWTTATEQNSQNFIVERSRDLVIWEFVSDVEAAGNSSTSINYAASDLNPIAGVSYYRLKQVDLNGAETIYGPISVACAEAENSMIVFPNPTKGNFTVEISSSENISNAQIQITDLTGKVINERTTNILEGKSQFTFEGLDLQLGTYIINLNTGNGKINPVRVVVN